MIKKSRLRVQKQKKGRRVFLFLAILAVIGVVGYQFAQHFGIVSSLKKILDTARNTLLASGPVRGTFYDRNLKQLAVTLERVSVYARTSEIDSIQETAAKLSQIFALDKEKLENQLKSGVLRLWIAEDISQAQEVSVKDLDLPGVYLQRDEKRYYPNNFAAAHIIGYVDNGIGLSGVEFYYDRLLADKKIKIPKGKPQLSNSLDLVLTLDLKIQGILENLVKDIAKSEQAEKVTAYLMESGTGEIIGGANLPGFDPNIFTKYSQEQTENMFLLPTCIPAKFRLFLRDATMLLAQDAKNVSPYTWSLVPDNKDVGGQLHFWDWLGLEEETETDFYVPTSKDKTSANQQKPVVAPTTDFGFVPETATPLNLLTAFSVLLNNGKKIHPFAVKKVLDRKTGAEVILTGHADGQSAKWSKEKDQGIESLFQSQATWGASGASYFRDDILVSVANAAGRQYLINDMAFVRIPVGGHNLDMLIFVQRAPQGVNPEEGEKENSMQHLVDDKIERISVLQQVAKSVADVVEPEIGDESNYQVKRRPDSELSSGDKAGKEITTFGVMPDLKGLSLRKSFRLLQGMNLEIHIQGTGRVVDQKPKQGTPLQGIKECDLILEKQVKTGLEHTGSEKK